MPYFPCPLHWYMPIGLQRVLFLVLLILVLPVLLYNVDEGVKQFMDANSRWFEVCPYLIGFWLIVMFWLGFHYANEHTKKIWEKEEKGKKKVKK